MSAISEKSSSSIKICPLVGSIYPASIFRSVVFPVPECPTIAVFFPHVIERKRLSKIVFSSVL